MIRTLRACVLMVGLASASIASAQDIAGAKAAIKNAQDQLAAAAAALASVPATGKTTTLAPGANVQTALTAAACGDTIVLSLGAYPGSLTMSKTCSAASPITVRSAVTITGRVAAGAVLPKITPSAGASSAIDLSGSGYVLRGLDVLGVLYGTITVEGANDIIDQCWIHGAPTGSFKRGVALNGTNDSVTRSYVADFHAEGQDSQAIGGWLGAGSYTIDNNYLEAASENILFGGADPTIANRVPSNITITNNYITKPLAWRTAQNWNIKNLVELKNAAHVTIAHNTIENVWQQAQGGFAIVLTVRDQDGTAPWSTIQDVTITENVVRHAGAGINVLGLDDSSTRPSVRMARVSMVGNLFYDIDPNKWNDPSSGQSASGRVLMINGGPNGFEFGHNTLVYASPNVSPTINSALTIGQGGDTFTTAGLNMHDNVIAEGTYGVIGDSVGIGVVALSRYAPGYLFADNLLIRGVGEDGVPNRYDGLYPTTTIVSAVGAVVVDAAFALQPAFAALPSTDGTPRGANISVLKATIAGLDLAK